jgi:hypothetical protein
MTIEPAYRKVKSLFDGYPRVALYQCLDLGDEWAFAFSGEPVAQNTALIGVAYDIVNKMTGEITHKSFIEDVGTFTAGRRIDAKLFDKL